MSLASLVAVPSSTHFRIPPGCSTTSNSGDNFRRVLHLRGCCSIRAAALPNCVGFTSPGAANFHNRIKPYPSLSSSSSSVLLGGISGGLLLDNRVWKQRRSGRGEEGQQAETTTRRRNVGLEARARASSSSGSSGGNRLQEAVVGVMDAVKSGWTTSPPTWESSFVSVGLICVLGAPAMIVGLTKAGMVSAYLLGSIIWRAYGLEGLLTIMFFYLLGTGATKLKMKEKQKEGIAEKRSGQRGVGSVLGSGTAALICALCSIYEVGGPDISPLWHMGYLASLCTKLSDTISSEIGKAYGKTTYLVTTLSAVPRGTEGAVSLEGTVAGLIAAVFLASAAYALNQVDQLGAITVVVASQLANLFESFLGATIQGRPGFKWITNDAVNVANITLGAAIAMLSKRYLG